MDWIKNLAIKPITENKQTENIFPNLYQYLHPLNADDITKRWPISDELNNEDRLNADDITKRWPNFFHNFILKGLNWPEREQ
jgi:hypothetical protein